MPISKTAAVSPADAAMQIVVQGKEQATMGRFQEAITLYDQAIELYPQCADAYFQRGMAHFSLGTLMASDFEKAISLSPDNPYMMLTVIYINLRLDEYVKAIELAQGLIEKYPNQHLAWMYLADGYARIGQTEAARSIYADMGKRFPQFFDAKAEYVLTLPTIPFSQEDIDRRRQEFMTGLDRLMKEGRTLGQIRVIPFFQAYHGRNDKELAQKLVQFFYKVRPDLAYTASHCRKPLPKKAKIRIGFVSAFLHVIRLNQFWLPIIEGLAALDFEVVIISSTPPAAAGVQDIAAKVHKYIFIQNNMQANREMIAQEALDILIYMEIGMDLNSYMLAMARLAPIQCMLAGHPVTSGMPTMDYYVSTHTFEPENAQEHYTEKLLLFDRVMAVFKRPPQPETLASREALGLPGEAFRLYCCPVTLFKLHPDMDAVFKTLLTRDPQARIILFDSAHKTLWRPQLQKRFAAIMPPEQVSRILFLPFANRERFFQILNHMDAILDPFHFSFGTTAYLTLGLNLPFVTWPGEFMRGRGGYALYQQMGVSDMIAATRDDYIELALRLANDRPFHEVMREKIRTLSDVLFDDVDMIGEFAARMRQLYADL